MSLDIGCDIPDATLLRNLAEDVPDMAYSIRERLRQLAAMLDEGRFLGRLRCRRCGEKADLHINVATAPKQQGGQS